MTKKKPGKKSERTPPPIVGSSIKHVSKNSGKRKNKNVDNKNLNQSKKVINEPKESPSTSNFDTLAAAMPTQSQPCNDPVHTMKLEDNKSDITEFRGNTSINDNDNTTFLDNARTKDMDCKNWKCGDEEKQNVQIPEPNESSSSYNLEQNEIYNEESNQHLSVCSNVNLTDEEKNKVIRDNESQEDNNVKRKQSKLQQDKLEDYDMYPGRELDNLEDGYKKLNIDNFQNKNGQHKRNASKRYEDKSQDKNDQFDTKNWVPSKSLKSYQLNKLGKDIEDKKFNEWLHKGSEVKFVHVNETEGDLFEASKEFCLGHCVAEDMSMGSGIAVTFRQKFKRTDELLNQRQKTGGLAYLDDENRFIYYMVTKKYSTNKPTNASLFKSLNKLKDHMVENKHTKLAIPRIGCGLDRLEWSEVKAIIEYIFSDTEINILVYNLSKQSDQDEPSVPNRIRNCKVVHAPYSLLEIDKYTIIIYTCSQQGGVTDQMKMLNTKFDILSVYKREQKRVGNVIRHEKNAYILYGFVVKKEENSCIDYIYFKNCIDILNANNKKDKYDYVAIEEIKDDNDDMITEKLVNLLRNVVRGVEVYVCKRPSSIE